MKWKIAKVFSKTPANSGYEIQNLCSSVFPLTWNASLCSAEKVTSALMYIKTDQTAGDPKLVIASSLWCIFFPSAYDQYTALVDFSSVCNWPYKLKCVHVGFAVTVAWNWLNSNTSWGSISGINFFPLNICIFFYPESELFVDLPLFYAMEAMDILYSIQLTCCTYSPSQLTVVIFSLLMHVQVYNTFWRGLHVSLWCI